MQSKWKIGDLVELSAAGKARAGNWTVRRGYGMVIELDVGFNKWPVMCHWPMKDGAEKKHSFKDYELKRLKVKK